MSAAKNLLSVMLSKPKACFLAFGLSLVFYLLNLPSDLLPGDSGELISASFTLGIAHPPGYPLYTMVGNLFSRAFSFGSVAVRYNLLSCLAASSMASFIVCLLIDLGLTSWIALLSTMILSTSKATWFEATTAEVYATSGLLLAIMLWAMVVARNRNDAYWLLFLYMGGLAISHHTTLVGPFLLCLLTLGLMKRRNVSTSCLIGSAMVFLLALSIWLYIPIRAYCNPSLIWSNKPTLHSFISHITAKGYHWRLKSISPQRFVDFVCFFPVLSERFSLVACAFSIIGAVKGLFSPKGEIKSVALLSIGIILFFGIHSAFYNIPDIVSHVFPAVVPLAVLAAIGADYLHGLLAGFKFRTWVFSIGLAALILLNVFQTHPRRDEKLAMGFAKGIVESAKQACGEGCLVLTTGEISSFPLLYIGTVESVGVTVYDLAISNPDILGLPDSPKDLEEAIDAAVGLYGIHRVAIAGYVPPTIGKYKTYVCGLISILKEPCGNCLNPHDFGLDGIGAEPDDYSSRLLKASYYIHIGRWHQQQGDLKGFEKYLDSAAQVIGDDAATLVNISGIYLHSGMAQKAYMVAKQATQADPEFFEAHDLLANILLSMGKPVEAIAEYRLALRGNPRPSLVYSNLGNSYLAVGKFEEALVQFEKALDLDSTLVNAWIGRGKALESLARNQEALQAYKVAYRYDKSSPVLYHSEFSLLLRMGCYDEALWRVREGLLVNPEDPVLLSDLGLWYLRKDMLDSAVFYLSSALEKQPALSTARGNLALAFQRMGRKKEAMENYKIYIESAPEGEMKEKARKALEALTSEQS